MIKREAKDAHSEINSIGGDELHALAAVPLTGANAGVSTELLGEIGKCLGVRFQHRGERYEFILEQGLGGPDSRGLNKPYPSEVLSARGYEHTLPIRVTTPFKYLMHSPVFMDKERTLLLLPTQIEGGEDLFAGGEVCCRDCLILLRQDPLSGTFSEIAAHQERPFEGSYRFVSHGMKLLDDGVVQMTFDEEGNPPAALTERRYRISQEGILPLTNR